MDPQAAPKQLTPKEFLRELRRPCEHNQRKFILDPCYACVLVRVESLFEDFRIRVSWHQATAEHAIEEIRTLLVEAE